MLLSFEVGSERNPLAMTLLRQIQMLLERTYAPAGVNLEECLVGRQRCTELSILAGPTTQELGRDGRTFLRIANGQLYLAIYYHPSVISALEDHPPFAELNRENIRPLIVFLEELNHALHAALLFLENRLQVGAEALLCDLELQAKIDTYLALKLFAAALRKRRQLTARHRIWLQKCLFGEELFSYKNPILKKRYRQANTLGLRLARYLDTLKSQERISFIRNFRQLSFSEKRRRILSLG